MHICALSGEMVHFMTQYVKKQTKKIHKIKEIQKANTQSLSHKAWLMNYKNWGFLVCVLWPQV